ncbi:hypothetical protein BDV18DRAFT_23776 [Aspergillus unguis]
MFLSTTHVLITFFLDPSILYVALSLFYLRLMVVVVKCLRIPRCSVYSVLLFLTPLHMNLFVHVHYDQGMYVTILLFYLVFFRTISSAVRRYAVN